MASSSISGSLPQSSIIANETALDSDVEEEFDELDESDSGIDEHGASTSTRQKGVGPTGGERIPGHSLLPSVKLENIIQADGTFFLCTMHGLNNDVNRRHWYTRVVQRRTFCSLHRHSGWITVGILTRSDIMYRRSSSNE